MTGDIYEKYPYFLYYIATKPLRDGFLTLVRGSIKHTLATVEITSRTELNGIRTDAIQFIDGGRKQTNESSCNDSSNNVFAASISKQ